MNKIGVPVVKRVVPPTSPAGGGKQVTIIGKRFTGATRVSFGTQDVPQDSFHVDSDTQITVSSNPRVESFLSPLIQTIVDVTVTTPNGTSVPNFNDLFTYVYSIPSVTSIIPPTAGSGGGNMDIFGSNFTDAGSVSFEVIGAFPQSDPSPVVLGDTEIVATCPNFAAGVTVHVRVNAPGGTSAPTSADQFTFQ